MSYRPRNHLSVRHRLVKYEGERGGQGIIASLLTACMADWCEQRMRVVDPPRYRVSRERDRTAECDMELALT